MICYQEILIPILRDEELQTPVYKKVKFKRLYGEANIMYQFKDFISDAIPWSKYGSFEIYDMTNDDSSVISHSVLNTYFLTKTIYVNTTQYPTETHVHIL